MKNTLNKYIAFILLAFVLLGSCNKTATPISETFHDVDVVYYKNIPHSVTDTATVNAGDSVYLDFKITSQNKNMYKVLIWEAGSGAATKTYVLTESQRKSFSAVFGTTMTKTGNTSYRIWAVDSGGIYLGDGYKKIDINITNDFSYWAGRLIYVPDTLSKQNNCYFSSIDGKLFNYTAGGASSDKIDFGYFYDTTLVSGAAQGPTIYALNVSKFLPYDISTWTKNATTFSALKTGQLSAFTNLKTEDNIITTAKGQVKSNITSVPKLASTGLFYFKTAAGKYGAVYVNFVTGNSAKNGSYMSIDVKMER